MIWPTWSAAVFLLDVADHLLAPVLAEIDIEVRHRHAVGIEEALEQQREAQRVEVGDGERIGDQRAGARAAARPDRDVLGLRPFDEVGDDQEIAGIFHPLDDAELVVEPRGIVFGAVARRQPAARQALGQALARLAGELGGLRFLGRLLVGGVAPAKRGRIGCAVAREGRSAAGDLDACCPAPPADRQTAPTSRPGS